ncbi:MAG: chloramphenicol acetyltransferase [Acidaminobacteraceae bacterium]
MKEINIENWNRKKHYEFFKNLDYPHFNVCANIDITEFLKYTKSNGEPFFISTLFLVMKSINSIKEFRYRMREETVVEHEVVHPSFTIMGDEDVFGFCYVDYSNDFLDFKTRAEISIEKAKMDISMEDEIGKDDMVFLTSMPWVSFTSISHPIQLKPADSFPRIAWGKFFMESGRVKLPLSVQVHHALMDGMHVGHLFIKVQEVFDDVEVNLK